MDLGKVGILVTEVVHKTGDGEPNAITVKEVSKVTVGKVIQVESPLGDQRFVDSEYLANPPNWKDTYERIIGEENTILSLKPWWDGLTKAFSSVGKLWTKANGYHVAVGTCFLVGNQYILTNHHNIRDKHDLKDIIIWFGYDHKDAKITELVPKMDGKFLTDDHLDFTIFEIVNSSKLQGLKLKYTTPKNKERANIIGYPQDSFLALSCQKNFIVQVCEEVIHYTTDTTRGHSGSPVFNNRWEIIALHHSAGKSIKDAKGNCTWLTNEGILISSILNRIKEMDSEVFIDVYP